MASWSYTLDSGQTFLSPGDSCADVRQAVRDQFGAAIATCDGGDSVVAAGSELRYLNQATGEVGTASYFVTALATVEDPPMNWGSEAMLMQSGLVAACVFALLAGIKAGDRL